jgi:hypothetical protein
VPVLLVHGAADTTRRLIVHAGCSRPWRARAA